MKIDFEHQQAAHCENGAVSNLLNFHGLKLSEPMVFGIGSGLFYSHFPFIKLNGIPATSYRILPGHVFKRLSKRLGIKVKREKFSNKEKAMRHLDEELERGQPVGMLTSVFYLPYLPKAFRFHFNAHNVVAFGKEGNKYLISDPVMNEPTEIEREDLIRARFAKGMPSTSGRMYYPTYVPQNIDLSEGIRKGIRKTASDMATIPVPIFAVNGIRYVAKRLPKWPDKLGDRKAILYLGQIIRMQEEIGTGGAGFRFIFAAFLQEAAEYLNMPELKEDSLEMTKIGDRWRDFAFSAGRICKGRKADTDSYAALSEIMFECAEREEALFKKLLKMF
ncbi:MAG: BtrH N-terminal domain-containing protein [Chitinophagales bacterium]